MLRIRALLTAVVLSSLLAACGGGSSSGGSGGTGGTGGSGGTGGTTPTNPCLTAMLADTGELAGIGEVAATGVTPDRGEKKALIDGDPRGRVYEARALHEAAQRKREALARAAAVTDEGFGRAAITSPAPVAEDVGEIAVVQDTGDLIVPANTYDLRSTGLRFSRNGSSYTLSRVDGNFRSTLGNRVTLTDDDSASVNIPFSFPFYGTGQTAAFVNSDGNITFGEADSTSTERNVARLVTGPPRVAPFFADLDPTTGVGKIFVNAASDGYTVTWCSVRGFDSNSTVTTQATLFPDGSVELKYSDAVNLRDAVVGIAPGHSGDIALVDLSTSTGSSAGAIAERFAQANSIDTFAVAKKFYQTHPDNYDQILLWTDQPLIQDAFAYELTVANEVRGIGQDIYDLSRSLGSAGRLRSLVVMDWLGKYPEDPAAKFLGENSTLSVLGQEVGHRWLAYMNFRDRTGARSEALLGRDLAHWSFFFDSDASVMEGNDIEDQGGGQFRTVDAVKRYSRLDQYAMGLVGVASVPPFFFVESPAGTTKTRGSAPAVGVSFTGTKREVLIEDVVSVMGQRLPSVADSSKTHRQAFIYVVSNGRTLDSGQVAKLDRFRREWETFFAGATEHRMSADTRLR
jgi:predicted small secreted protein